ncbi:WD40 repeat-like protein [Rhizoclosmatium globosum]|uniref:WD40 repeat-like protein n=1 Tax=Rhizoclosmatium globosum TaxID=329046 RepID=A0A1Y2D3A8_9FUNG|nr:WD40 repeat-like protein [Rhizoclosmatium globosum]|eukprot:ORY53035.1 WD40 repeat-like protein [Rhizoclosmatium globosum]
MFIPSKIGSAGSSAQNSSTALANAPPTGITFADTAIGDGSTDGNSGEKEKFFGKMRRKTSFYIPNSNTKANTSTFVNKIVTYDNLALFLTSRGPEAHYFFINIGRQFLWADYTLETKPALSCLQLKEAFVTCHDVNPLTRENMDTVLGFNTGDIMIYSPISGKYDRKNKQFVISKSAVTCIKWMPGSESLFMVGFADGAVMILDKDREDSSTVVPLSSDESSGFPIYKPPKGAHKHNPISQWQLSKRPITSIQFSPDSVHVAITSSDGCLRILDHTTERLLDTCSSYFGGLICCAWSPDGKYVVTGGEDDLVTIWAFGGRIVARCQGHSSWVTSVAFDPYNCTERSYRFASVSDDTRICMWDFSASSLHKPRVRKSRYVDSDKVATNNVHPVLSKKQVAILEPFMTQSIHTEPLHFIAFREDSVVTADRIGVVKFWSRPKVDILEDGDM